MHFSTNLSRKRRGGSWNGISVWSVMAEDDTTLSFSSYMQQTNRPIKMARRSVRVPGGSLMMDEGMYRQSSFVIHNGRGRIQ
mmetsp:Transcript_32477/g.58749  ORF Transcript_32477/g.58749 Transcript_32477/m.58749 type:complete len:82 (-) Transcript_32477:263-508(-)